MKTTIAARSLFATIAVLSFLGPVEAQQTRKTIDEAAASLSQVIPGTGIHGYEAARALSALCEKERGGGIGHVRQEDGTTYVLLTCNNDTATYVLRRNNGVMAPASAQEPLFSHREQTNPQPITSATSIFAIIDAYDPSRQSLQIRMVSSAMSADGSTILFPGDTISAVIDPLKPGNTRQAVCVTNIQGREGTGRVIPHRPAFPREGCLAQLHDYEGSAGLPATDIRVGLPVRVMLNGDLLLEGRKG